MEERACGQVRGARSRLEGEECVVGKGEEGRGHSCWGEGGGGSVGRRDGGRGRGAVSVGVMGEGRGKGAVSVGVMGGGGLDHGLGGEGDRRQRGWRRA